MRFRVIRWHVCRTKLPPPPKKIAYNPFWWAILGFKISRIEGDMKNQGEKKTKKQKKTKCQDMERTHLLGGCLVGAFSTVKLGIFRDLTRAYPPGRVRANKLYRYEKWFEDRGKGSEKNLTGVFLKVFRRPKFAQKMFFSPRGSAGRATLKVQSRLSHDMTL